MNYTFIDYMIESLNTVDTYSTIEAALQNFGTKGEFLEWAYKFEGDASAAESVLMEHGWQKVGTRWIKNGAISSLPSATGGTSVATSAAANMTAVADDLIIDTTAREVTVKSATAASLKSPKTILACVVTAICGYDLGVGIYELWDKYFGDGSFDWDKYSIGGNIMTFLSSDRDGNVKSYVDEQLIEDIRQRLIDVGFFNQNFEPFDFGNRKTIKWSELEFDKSILPTFYYHGNWLLNKIASYNANNGNVLSDSHGEPVTTLEMLDDWNISGFQTQITKGDGSKHLKDYLCMTRNIDKNSDMTIEMAKPSTSSTESQIVMRESGKYNMYKVTAEVCESLGTQSFNVNNTYQYISCQDYYDTGSIEFRRKSDANYYKGATVVADYTNLGHLKGNIPQNDDANMPDSGKNLAENYPEWFNNAKTQTHTVGDTTTTNTVLPLTINDIPTEDSEKPDSSIKPNSNTQNNAQSGTTSENNMDESIGIKDANSTFSQPDIDTDGGMIKPTKPDGFFPDIGSNDDPMILNPATDSMLGLVALYNPTVAQIKEFSQFLWGNDFVSAFKKLFSDPMQAVIGLHWIYATPNKSTVSTIKVGYVDSGVESITVPDIYTTIDCGSIHVNHVFHNALDYKALHCSIYLPFIGIKELSIGDVMDSDVHVKYNVDHLTGTCLATIQIKRDGLDAGIYQFSGNCAVQLPISGGSYTSIITNLVGLAATIGSTVATGGALAPIAVGSAANLLTNSKTSTERTGSIGSNAGAMGYKKPFLLIQGNKSYNATGYSNYMGDASNSAVTLKQCTGFQRVKEINLSIADATDSEKSEIIQILKSGFFIS